MNGNDRFADLGSVRDDLCIEERLADDLEREPHHRFAEIELFVGGVRVLIR